MDSILGADVFHQAELGGRLLVAALLAGVLGYERETKRRPAGLRTHMLTALAAAIFTIAAMELYREVRDTSEKMSADPIRAIEAVTAGAGFLAAGAIIQLRGRVVGITTGASVWLSAAVGLASGAGYYVVAVLATLLAAVILAVLIKIERRLGTADDEEEDAKGASA